MASIYDWGLNQATNQMIDLSTAFARDRQMKAAENAQNIVNQKNMMEMEKQQKQEEMLSKRVNMTGYFTSQGMHPEVVKATEDIFESMGYGKRNPAGFFEMEARNVPTALKTIEDQPKHKLAIAQTEYQMLQGHKNKLMEEIQGKLERDPFYTSDPKYQEAANKISQIDARMSMRGKQIGEFKSMLEKSDNAMSEAEILSGKFGEKAKNDYIAGKIATQKPTAPKAPTVHTFTEGNETVEKQWDDATGTWKEMSRGPRYKPTSGGLQQPKVAQTTFVDPETGIPYVFDNTTGSYRPGKIEGGGGVTAKPSAPSPEKAAKEQLITQALSYMPDIKQMILGPDVSKPIVDRTAVLNASARTPFTKGRQASTLILDAVEAKLRAESGAAVPDTEVKRIAKRYIPQAADDDATIIMKLNNMEGFLQGTQDKMQMGKSPQAKGTTVTPRKPGESISDYLKRTGGK